MMNSSSDGNVEWGPEIPVNGVRPEWLGDDQPMRWYWPGGMTVDWRNGRGHVLAGKVGKDSWHAVGSIRLPANHSHYATLRGGIDWSAPIEAVHEDGRVMRLSLLAPSEYYGSKNPDNDGHYWTNGPNGKWCWLPAGGVRDGWHIRNVATKAPAEPVEREVGPHTSQECLERMEALVRRLADDANTYAANGLGYGAEARAILALLPEPIDGDLVEARKLAAEVEDFPHGSLEDLALAAIKRGRALQMGEGL